MSDKAEEIINEINIIEQDLDRKEYEEFLEELSEEINNRLMALEIDNEGK